MKAVDRLVDLVTGGPYELRQWVIMVRLASEADDAGIVKKPEPAVLAQWINDTEGWAKHTVRALIADGWITETDTGKWDISRLLRKGLNTSIEDLY